MKTETAYLLASIVYLHKCASMYVDLDLWFDTYSEQMSGLVPSLHLYSRKMQPTHSVSLWAFVYSEQPRFCSVLHFVYSVLCCVHVRDSIGT